MKLTHKKNLLIGTVTVVILGGIYFYYHPSQTDNGWDSKINTSKNETGIYVLPKTLQEKGITDVFQGQFYSKLDTNSQGGQRYSVNISNTKLGDASGMVVVIDNADNFKSLLDMGKGSPDYNFYTKYDSVTKSYIIIKAGRTPTFIDP